MKQHRQFEKLFSPDRSDSPTEIFLEQNGEIIITWQIRANVVQDKQRRNIACNVGNFAKQFYGAHILHEKRNIAGSMTKISFDFSPF